MNPTPLHRGSICCTVCGKALPADGFNSGGEMLCGGCGAGLTVDVFPSLFHAPGAVSGETLTVEGVAGCFYHPHKKAASLCASCGRFLCSLCETDLAGRCLCPSCVDKARSHEEIEQLVTRRTLHDSAAFTLSVLPLLAWPFTVITAPVALFIAIRFWNRPGSLLPRTRVRSVLAVLFSSVQVVGWLALIARKVF